MGSRTPRDAHTNARPASGREGPRLRSDVFKIGPEATRWVLAGHPWVFRDALARQGHGVATGDVVHIHDEEGRFLGSGLFEEEGAIAVRMVGFDKIQRFDRGEIARRLAAAVSHRERVIGSENASAHRIVHGEVDGFPALAIDRLGDYLLVYIYGRSVDAWLDALIDVMAETMQFRGIYVQDRARSVVASEPRKAAQLVRGEPTSELVIVEEDGLRFAVDPTAPVSPGLFLDLREGRRLAERESVDCHVLNLFSFTGAFALRAVRGRAASVTNVDSAARSHARCRQNLAESGLDPESCEALTGDVFKHLERFRQRGRTFDLIVVDPPPFSTVRGGAFSAHGDWADLTEAVSGVAHEHTRVLAVCNAAGMTDADFGLALGQGMHRADRLMREVGRVGLPPDFPLLPAFPEGAYLKVRLLQYYR